MHSTLVTARDNVSIIHFVIALISSSKQLSVHVLFHGLCLHFNFLCRDVGAHPRRSIGLLMRVGPLSELFQSGWRKTKRESLKITGILGHCTVIGDRN